VAERCTCGATLLEGALFCHKCGKPQRDISPAEPEPAPSPPPPTAVAPAPPAQEISFHNRIAVRVAMLCAALSMLVVSVPMPVFLTAFWMLLWLAVAGFLAVYIYHRRTGVFLTVRGGARMGWLTGIFCYLIALVLFALTAVLLSRSRDLAAALREQMQNQGGANVEEALRLLESPGEFTVVILTMLVFFFLVFTGLPMIGGALGAKVLEKD
jgi:hypothetical protein